MSALRMEVSLVRHVLLSHQALHPRAWQDHIYKAAAEGTVINCQCALRDVAYGHACTCESIKLRVTAFAHAPTSVYLQPCEQTMLLGKIQGSALGSAYWPINSCVIMRRASRFNLMVPSSDVRHVTLNLKPSIAYGAEFPCEGHIGT